MKKLVLVAAVAFSASLFSCGSADKAAEAADLDPQTTEMADTLDAAEPADTTAAAADTTAAAADTTVVAE
ncbi:MAG: hypothetical protein J1E29_08090 [Duncaniella sp.]|nr:hypothetical protein [Duncaniella sp.]